MAEQSAVQVGDQVAVGPRNREIEPWRQELDALIRSRGAVRVNGKPASQRTQELVRSVLHTCFRQLWEGGYRIEKPTSFAKKHVDYLATRWYRNGLSPKTIQNQLSQLRKFSGWLGKSGIVGGAHEHIPELTKPLRVSATATHTKSWSGNGIDVVGKIREAMALDARFGVMLLLCAAFGLRRREVIMLKPWVSDLGAGLNLPPNSGPKGGRERFIPIQSPWQRQVLDLAKTVVGRKDAMGWPRTRLARPATLKYQLKEWNHRLQQIGISRRESNTVGHGLRAEYAEISAMLNGLTPPVLGGTRDQMTAAELDAKREQVSHNLGHNRIGITSSYYGSFGRQGRRPESPNGSTKDVSRSEQTETILADFSRVFRSIPSPGSDTVPMDGVPSVPPQPRRPRATDNRAVMGRFVKRRREFRIGKK